MKKNVKKKIIIIAIVGSFCVTMIGCSTTETSFETTKAVQEIITTKKEISETEVKKEAETTVASVKQKTYTLEDYKKYIEDEYTGNSRIEGDYVVSDIYDEYDEDGNFLAGVVSRTQKQSIEQLNQVLAWKDAGQSMIKSYKSKMAATNDGLEVLVSYTLLDGQTVELKEGNRPEIPDGYVSEYVAEMYVRGTAMTSNTGGKTSQEKAEDIRIQSAQEHQQRMDELADKQDAAREAYEEDVARHKAEYEEQKAEMKEKFRFVDGLDEIVKKYAKPYKDLIETYAVGYELHSIYEFGYINEEYQLYPYIAYDAYTTKSALIYRKDWPEFAEKAIDLLTSELNELIAYKETNVEDINKDTIESRSHLQSINAQINVVEFDLKEINKRSLMN